MIKIALLSYLAITPANTDKATTAANQWMNLYLPTATIVTAPSCEEWDTDDNSMVRCNLTYKDEGGLHPLTLECPSAWLWQFTSECHMTRPY
jgi:hypothetical protein